MDAYRLNTPPPKKTKKQIIIKKFFMVYGNCLVTSILNEAFKLLSSLPILMQNQSGAGDRAALGIASLFLHLLGVSRFGLAVRH